MGAKKFTSMRLKGNMIVCFYSSSCIPQLVQGYGNFIPSRFCNNKGESTYIVVRIFFLFLNRFEVDKILSLRVSFNFSYIHYNASLYSQRFFPHFPHIIHQFVMEFIATLHEIFPFKTNPKIK